MTDKLPPYNEDVEESLLGSILIDGDALGVVDLGPEDFFDEANQHIFRAMLNIQDQGIDQLTVGHELGKMGRLDEVGGLSYLSHLVAGTPTSLHAEYYANIVRQCAFNRRLISAAGQIEALGHKNLEPALALGNVGSILNTLGKSIKENKLWTPHDMSTRAMDRYLAMLRQPPGLATGFNEFDQLTGGLFRGEYIVLAGRGGMGKTTLALQWARYMAKKLNVLFVSMEMAATSVTDKNVAATAGRRNRTIARGNYSDDVMGGINQALGILSELNLYILEGNQTTAALRKHLEKQIATHGCDVLMVDYLQRFADKYGSNPNERVSHISGELAVMARDYNLPLIALAQLNRQADSRESKQPQLTDLRDSGAIEQDADMVLFVFRPSYYDRELLKAPQQAAELIIAKDRLRGCSGHVDLTWDKELEIYV